MICIRFPSIVLWMESKLSKPIIQEQTKIPQTQRRTGARTARRDERKSRDGALEASRERTARGAWCGKHKRKASPDMLTGRSVQACLSREVPTDHEARGQRSGGCGKEQECRSLLRSRDDSALAGVHPRVPGRTPSASGREQESHNTQSKEEETKWCWSDRNTQHVKERVRANSSPRSSSRSAMRASCRVRRTDENDEKSPAALTSTRVEKK